MKLILLFLHKHMSVTLLVSLLILSCITRLLNLSDIPFRLDGDAGWMANNSISVWKSKAPLFGTGVFDYQNGFYYLNGIFLKLFGENIFGMRIFPALGGIAATITTYLLASQLFNKRIGILASFFLIFLPIHLVFSRDGTDMIHTTWLLPITLYFLYLGMTKDMRFNLLSGIFLGLSQYFYTSARFIPIVILISFVVLAYKKVSRRHMLLNAICLIVPCIVIYGPMLLFYISHSGALFSRINQVGILQTHWIQNQGSEISGLKKFANHAFFSYEVLFNNDSPKYFHYGLNRFLPLFTSILLN